MTPLSDRLQVVRPQWEAQLDAFHTLSTRALDSAEQLLALNLKTSRASLDQATGALQQMLHATDVRDLFAIGTQAQGQWQQVLSYSREVLGIAMGARQRSWSSIPQAPLQLLPAPAVHLAEQAGIALAEATTVTSEIATAAADTTAALAEDTMGVGDQSTAAASGPDGGLQPAGQIEPAAVPDAATPSDAPTELDAEKTGEALSEAPSKASESESAAAAAPDLDQETSANVDALVDIVIADEVPPAKAKPLVEALNEVAPRPVSAEHPLSSTVPLQADGHIDLPLVTPAEATPPVQLSTGPAPTERRRSSRKKS